MGLDLLNYHLCFEKPRRLTDVNSWHGHIPFAFTIVQILRPKIFVELGTHKGDSYCAFCQAVDMLELDTMCYAIDTWRGDQHSGFYGPEILEELHKYHDTIYGRFSRLIQCTFDQAIDRFSDCSVDLLHIDGLHTYDVVKHDFENWLPKMSSHGIILLHDTNVRKREFGVWQLWEELRDKYPSFEFKHGNGLGILVVGNDVSKDILSLIDIDSQDVLLKFFSELGNKVILEHSLEQELQSDIVLLQSNMMSKIQELRADIESLQYDIGSEIQELQSDIESKDADIRSKDIEIRRLEQELQSNIESKETDILAKEADILAKETDIQSKDIEIRRLKQELQSNIESKDADIRAKEADMQSKDIDISNLGNEIVILNDRLNGFESSVSVRFIRSITSAIDKIFPDSTIRGEFRRIIVYSVRTITNEGIRSYLRHISVKIKRREFKIVDKRSENIEDRNVQLRLWIAKNEPSSAMLIQYKKDIKNFRYKPKISIITPVYNPDVSWIKAAVESVIKQTYENWELCIADASTEKDVIKYLKDCAKKDSRIKIKFLTENKGIAGNSNEALYLATGEYIGLLDHDDEIAPDALYEVVKYLQCNDVDMIYSDEDKIDINGNRKDAFFKPDWSPDTFLSCMYTCHFGVYKKKIIDEIGGFRPGYDGSQDYDLVLRFIEKTKNIHHIPKILYHWRMVPGSAAATVDAKSYAYVAAKKSLTDYIRRNNISGEILDGFWTGSYRLKRELSRKYFVSIIIPTRDNVDILKRCIESIFKKTSYDNYEIIIVDNDSIEKETHDYFKLLRKIDNIKILDYPKEFNFSSINNFAAKNANGDMILFLNNDTEIISEEWIVAMLEHAQRSDVGIVGCKLLYPDKTVQHAGVILGLGDLAGHSHINFSDVHHGYFGRINITQNLSAVTAACMMMRKDVFEEIGGFDENIAIAFNDVDLCIKVREKGYLIVYTPYAELYHHESASRGYEDTPEKQKRFLEEIKYLREKWGNIIDVGDPYYNPNLTLSKGDFSIRI